MPDSPCFSVGDMPPFSLQLKKAVVHGALPAVNKVAKLARLKLVPRNAPNRNFAEFLRHLSDLDFSPKTIIDVGVAFGSPGLHDPGAKFYLVEPVPHCGDTIAQMARALGGEAFNVAAGSFDGEMPFFVHADTSGSSAYRQQEGPALDGEEVMIPVRRLDTLIPRTIEGPVLLKIDTQGAELDVMIGATGLLDLIDVVIMEASFHEFRLGIPEIGAVMAFMGAIGFVCYEILEGHYRALDNALAQVDLVFVKPDSPLRKNKHSFTPDQARRYVAR